MYKDSKTLFIHISTCILEYSNQFFHNLSALRVIPFLIFTIFQYRYISLLRIQWKYSNRIVSKNKHKNYACSDSLPFVARVSALALAFMYFNALSIPLFICANCYREGKNLVEYNREIAKTRLQKLGSRASDIAVRTRGYFSHRNFL